MCAGVVVPVPVVSGMFSCAFIVPWLHAWTGSVCLVETSANAGVAAIAPSDSTAVSVVSALRICSPFSLRWCQERGDDAEHRQQAQRRHYEQAEREREQARAAQPGFPAANEQRDTDRDERYLVGRGGAVAEADRVRLPGRRPERQAPDPIDRPQRDDRRVA